MNHLDSISINNVTTTSGYSTLTGIPPRQVKRLCKSGKLRCKLVGMVYLILLDEVKK